MNIKKIIIYVLLILIIAFVEFSFFDFPNHIVDAFFGFVFLLLIIFIVKLVTKNEFIVKRWFYYSLILMPILTFLLIMSYRNYFLIAIQSHDYGKSRELIVFGTGHQPKLFEMIIEVEDTTWVYYNFNGDIEETLKSPKYFSSYYFYSKEIPDRLMDQIR